MERCVSLAVLLSLLTVGLTEGESAPNLALNKPTTQSSTNTNNAGYSRRAVDGNTNGNYWKGKSCTNTIKTKSSPWWSVDLEEITRVTDVVLYNRVDCCGNMLRDLDVIVSNSPNPSDEEGTLCGHHTGRVWAKKAIHCERQAEGRYVIVSIPGKRQALTLCEVMVYNRAANLALGKPTRQSTTSSGGESDRAVDGNTNGIFESGQSCMQTSVEYSPWWSLDLGEVTRVTDVTLYNRVDCCGDKLADFDVKLSSTYRPYYDSDEMLCYHFDGVAGDKVTIHCGHFSEGRYLIVNIPRVITAQLTLCEVEIYNNGPGPNLALGKQTFQSGTSENGNLGQAVDGHTGGTYSDGSCMQTDEGWEPWWAVDLGNFTEVTDLTLFTCCGNSLANFDVIVTWNLEFAHGEITMCKHVDEVVTDTVNVQCGQVARGRFVRVMLRDVTSSLTLCEVQVYNNAS